MKNTTSSIVVAGDALVDWFEACSGSSQSRLDAKKDVPNWKTYPQGHRWIMPGGALLLAEFLRAAAGSRVIGPAVRGLRQIPAGRIIRSYANAAAFPMSTLRGDEGKKVYRLSDYAGFEGPEKKLPPPPAIKGDDANAALVVLDDSNNGFRDQPLSWPKAIRENKKPIIIYKTSWPFAQGQLWDRLISHCADRLVTIVTVDDLRLEGVHISRRLSWERTVKDLLWQYNNHHSFQPLQQGAFLIVRFGVEGAVLICNREKNNKAMLFYDPAFGEDSFGQFYPGIMPGMGCAFTAALAALVTNPDKTEIQKGIQMGLLSARELWKRGFGSEIDKFAYPYSCFAPNFPKKGAIVQVLLPDFLAENSDQAEKWSLLHDLAESGLEQAARYYVEYGKDTALDRVPSARYRDLYSIDRSEIESYRSIHNLIQEYLWSAKKTKPLAVAVFGAPGAGKSFGISEIAESIAPGSIKKIEFNLSQFISMHDLISAFHKIRDISLGGAIPLVFFDEFDSAFNTKLGWLKYFLGPIQDGAFREGETVHPLGKAVFVFAGGIYHTYAEFAQIKTQTHSDQQEAQCDCFDEEAKSAKLPDFISRLRGYIDIKGPNPVGDDDPYFVIRRALLWRFLIASNARHLVDANKKLLVDPGVLRALLKVPCFKHGVRSMLAILDMSMLAQRKSFEPAALPSKSQLNLHVDADAFYDLVLRDALLSSQLEKIAQAIHEQFLQDHQGRKPASDPAMQPWERLEDKFASSNRAAAADIPTKLEAIGCNFEAARGILKPFSFSKNEIELLAKMEHERWNRERTAAGWTLGPRDPDNKITPYLVAWELLPEEIKEYDREAVRAIPQAMVNAGFKIFKK